MSTEGQRLGILWVEALHDLGPEHAGGAQLGNLHEVVHANTPEEGDARGKIVDIQASLHPGAQVFQTVGERVGKLNVGGRACLLQVVAAYADAVEFRHPGGAITEDVADDSHGAVGRVDIGIADHELFQNVVLDGPAQLFRRYALLFGGNDIERHDGQHGAVHGH